MKTLFLFLVIVAVATTASCIDYSTDGKTSIGAYSYIVYQNGSSCVVEDHLGGRVYSSANATASIKYAIDSAYYNKAGGKVYLKKADYPVAATILVRQKVSLEGEYGAVLYPTANVDIIRVPPGGSVKNIVFEPKRLASWSKSCIYMTSLDRGINYWPAAYHIILENIDIWMNYQQGTGVFLDGSAISNPGYYICGVVGDNINVLGGKYGIRLLKNGTSWVNANQFDNCHFFDTEYCIDLGAVNPADNWYGLDGNVFSNVQTQYQQHMKRAVRIGGQYNRIDGMFWDYVGSVAVELLENSNGNKIVAGVVKSKILDKGKKSPEAGNSIEAYI